MDQHYFLVAIEGIGDTPAPIVGTAPTSLTATADADSIGLAWTNSDTYTSTVIERKTTGQYSALGTAAGNATSYDDTTAVAGTEYTYKVRGVKSGYPTPYSNESSATISAGPVAATGTYTIINYADVSMPDSNLTIDNTGITEGLDWHATISNNATALSIAAAINLNLGSVTASATNAVVTITAVVPGAAGNSITFDKGAITNTGMTISGGTLSGGSD